MGSWARQARVLGGLQRGASELKPRQLSGLMHMNAEVEVEVDAGESSVRYGTKYYGR